MGYIISGISYQWDMSKVGHIIRASFHELAIWVLQGRAGPNTSASIFYILPSNPIIYPFTPGRATKIAGPKTLHFAKYSKLYSLIYIFKANKARQPKQSIKINKFCS